MRALDLPLGYRSLSLRAPTLSAGGHINCYIVGHVNALIVDPGPPGGSELQRLRQHLWHLRGSGGTLAAVFLTHHHRAHSAGAATIAREFDLPVAAHLHTLAAMRAQLAGRTRPAETLQVADGDCFEIDQGRPLRAFHTPGHTSGHCCLFDASDSVLLCGDMLQEDDSSPPIDAREGNMASYLESLTRLQSLGPRWLLAGHGPTQRGGRVAIARLLAHHAQREAVILEQLERAGGPLSLSLLATRACQPPTFVAHTMALRSVDAHLIKLQRDGKVRQLAHALWAAVEYK